MGTRAPGTSAPGMYPGMMMPREGALRVSPPSRGHAQRQPSAMFARVFDRYDADASGGGVLPGADPRGGAAGFPGVHVFAANLHGGGASLLPGRAPSGSSRARDRAPRGAAEARGAGARGGRARRAAAGLVVVVAHGGGANRAVASGGGGFFRPGRRARARGTPSTRTRRPRASARARGALGVPSVPTRGRLVRVFVDAAAGRAFGASAPASRSGGRARRRRRTTPAIRSTRVSRGRADGRGRDGGRGRRADVGERVRGIREAKLIHA